MGHLTLKSVTNFDSEYHCTNIVVLGVTSVNFLDGTNAEPVMRSSFPILVVGTK